MSLKKSNETVGNRTCDLPACSAVPQPTVPPLVSNVVCLFVFGATALSGPGPPHSRGFYITHDDAPQ